MAKIGDSTVIFNNTPAGFGVNKWFDASVTGNGKVGAAVLGSFCNEEILINRADLRHGGYTGVLQDVSDKFPQVRKLYTDGKIFEAESLLSNEFTKKGYHPKPEYIMPLAMLGLDYAGGEFVTEYVRTTDMKSGEVVVSYKQGATRIVRKMFVARNTDLICYETEKNGPDKINLILSVKTPSDLVLQNPIVKFEGGYVYFSARSLNGLDYGFVARVVVKGGTAELTQNGLALKGIDDFTLFVKTFTDSARDNEFKKLKLELSAIKLTYDKLLVSSAGVHKKLFDAVSLSLNGGSDKAEIGSLLASVREGVLDAALLERLWNFGKFLAICGLPATDIGTPSGLWHQNGEGKNSFFSINNVAQLLYCGITLNVAPDVVLGLLSYFEKYIDDLRKNAARIFGLKGYFIPSVISPKSALLGLTDAETIHFISSGALIANLFYSYYLTVGDVKMLRSRIFPFMREICSFYGDFLKLDPNGFYTTVPSCSPSSVPGNTIQGKPLKNFGFATNCTIDFLAIGTLLDNLIEAATTLNTDVEIPMWRDMKTKIPVFGATDLGCLREYTNSPFSEKAENAGTMHTYGLWPLKNISFNDETIPYKPLVAIGSAAQNSVIGLRKASYNAINMRLNKAGALQSARTMAIFATQLSHSGEIESAKAVKNLLMKLLVSCFTTSGLCLSNDWRGSGFTNSNVASLDICGNLGLATAITECIVQSNSSKLRILPCVFDEMSSGKIVDVVTDFAARVSVDWDIKKGKCVVKIVPKTNCVIDIQVVDAFKRVRGKELKMDTAINGISGLNLVAGRPTLIEFY